MTCTDDVREGGIAWRIAAILFGGVLLAGLLAGCGDGGAGDREARAGYGDDAPTTEPAPVLETSAAELGSVELGSLDADEVTRVTHWTEGRLSRGAYAAEESIDRAVLEDVSFEEFESFDRVVFDFSGTVPEGFAYHLEYIREARECGSGAEVRAGGSGWLFVQILDARAHEEGGEATVDRAVRAPGLPNLKEAHLLCDMEGTVEWLLAAATPRPFRVVEAAGVGRLVVDIQH